MPDPPRLPPVLHDDRHLRLASFLPGVHGLADYLVAYQRNERLLVIVIHIGEIGKRPFGDARHRKVEPFVDGLAREPREHLAKSVFVSGRYGSNSDFEAVQQGYSLPNIGL